MIDTPEGREGGDGESSEALRGDLPSGGAGTAAEPSEAASGAEGDAEAASGEPGAGDEELIRQTAPVFLSELVIAGHMHWLQKTPGGGMQLKLVPATPSAQGPPRLQMPAYVFEFSSDGWEKFKRAVASDGEAPSIPIATELPRQVNGFVG